MKNAGTLMNDYLNTLSELPGHEQEEKRAFMQVLLQIHELVKGLSDRVEEQNNLLKEDDLEG